MPHRRQKRRPADGKGDQQFRRRRHPRHQRCRHKADEQPHQTDQRRPIDKHHHHIEKTALPVRRPRPLADRRQHDHRGDHHKVLDDQEPQRDAPMQRVDLALVRQQLDDDDGGRERERNAHINGRHPVKPKRQRDQESEGRRKNHLPQPGHQRHRPQRPHKLQVELQPHQEQQHRNAQFGQEVDMRVRPGNAQDRRPRQHANGNETDDQRLAQQQPRKADSCGQHKQRGNFIEDVSGNNVCHSPTPWPGSPPATHRIWTAYCSPEQSRQIPAADPTHRPNELGQRIQWRPSVRHRISAGPHGNQTGSGMPEDHFFAHRPANSLYRHFIITIDDETLNYWRYS